MINRQQPVISGALSSPEMNNNLYKMADHHAYPAMDSYFRSQRSPRRIVILGQTVPGVTTLISARGI